MFNWKKIFYFPGQFKLSHLELECQIFQKNLKKKIPKRQQLQYLPKLLNSKEKKILITLALIGVFSLIWIAQRLYLSFTRIAPSYDGEYNEGVIGQPKLINPLLSSNDIDNDLNKLIFSGLLKYNANLEMETDLAETIDISTDSKKYTFCLKKNLYWHDQKPLTFEDILFTFELIKNPDLQSPLYNQFEEIKLWPIDKRCFQFELEKPSQRFLNNLTVGILPKHIWSKIPFEEFVSSQFNLKPIGSGPFRFKELAKDKQGEIKYYTLERFKYFYDSPAYLKEISFWFYPSFNQAVQSLKRNEISGLGYVPKENSKELSNLKNIQKQSFTLPYYTALFFNLRNSSQASLDQIDSNETSSDQIKPAWIQNKSIRQALAYLTPKKEIFNQVLKQEGTIINSPILPHSFAHHTDLPIQSFNPEQANKLLNQQGWIKNQGQIFEKDNQILQIELTTANQPDLVRSAKLIQKIWQENGIQTKLIILPSEQIQEILPERKFQVLLYGVLENINSDPYPLWHSSQNIHPGLNLTGFSNRRADELLEKAKISKNPIHQKNYWMEFQEIISEQQAVIFLYNTTYNYFLDQEIKGIDMDHIRKPNDRFNNIKNWYINTKRILKFL